MRKIIGLPTNKAFFDIYANSIETFRRNSILAQLVSFGTEVGTIYLFFQMKFSEIMQPGKANVLAVGLALFLAAVLEYSLRGALVSFIRQLLNKRFKGLHRFITIGDFITVLAFVGLSGFLSWQGSKKVIAPKVVGEFQKVDYEGIQSLRSNREAATIENYKTEKKDIESRFSSQIAAISNSYDAKIESKNRERDNYREKESETGESYKTRLKRIEGQRQELKADQAAEVAQLQALKSEALAKAEKAKSRRLEEAQKEYSDRKSQLDTDNQKNREKNETQIKGWGLGFGWFSIAALIYLIYALFRIEVVKHGSGMIETPLPSTYFFRQGFFAEAWEALTERINRFWYGVINSFASKTRPPLLPDNSDVPFLYDTAGMEQLKIKVEFEPLAEPLKIGLPPITEKLLNQLKGSEAKIKTPDKRPIGFQNNPKSQIENLKKPDIGETDLRKSSNENSGASNQRVCVHCSNNYVYRHHKQKYCSDECRIAAWETRTGKQLKMKKKR